MLEQFQDLLVRILLLAALVSFVSMADPCGWEGERRLGSVLGSRDWTVHDPSSVPHPQTSPFSLPTGLPAPHWLFKPLSPLQ